jgi:hypothetical protein
VAGMRHTGHTLTAHQQCWHSSCPVCIEHTAKTQAANSQHIAP